MSFPKLFVTDLDGTALGNGFEPYARFPDPFSEFLDKLDAKGCRWAINTTWDPHGQWQLVLGSAVKSEPLFFMGELGYRVSQLNEGKLESVQPYTTLMEEKLESINQKSLRPLISDICSKFSAEKIFYYGHLFQFIPVEADKENLQEYATEKYLNSDVLTCKCNQAGSFSAYPSILKKSANLREVVTLTGLSPDDIVVAGDETADIEMMQPELARHAVCPNNAADQVKEHVSSIDGVIGDEHSGLGVIDAFGKLAQKQGWEW